MAALVTLFCVHPPDTERCPGETRWTPYTFFCPKCSLWTAYSIFFFPWLLRDIMTVLSYFSISCPPEKQGKSQSQSGSCSGLHIIALHIITFVPALNPNGHFVWTQSHCRGHLVGRVSPAPLEHCCTRWKSIHNSCNSAHILSWL